MIKVDYRELIKGLEARLSPKRFKHTLGVSETALLLAGKYGVDQEKAKLAGLLHDYARELPMETLLHQAVVLALPVDEIEREEPVLLHVKIGMHLVKQECGVEDDDILQAISLHTTGSSHMSTLAKIIFLADYIEPGRDFEGVAALRKAAHTNLDKAMLLAYDYTISHIIAKHGFIHPNTIIGRNYLLMQERIN